MAECEGGKVKGVGTIFLIGAKIRPLYSSQFTVRGVP